jgi:very-short-patch-repair endonuclease
MTDDCHLIGNTMSPTEEKELLVALLPRKSSLDILRTERWYHMPVDSMPGRWREGWRPKAMAFYQGRVFEGDEAYKIRFYGEVDRIDVVPRRELFPDDEANQHKAENPYYRVSLRSVQMRYRPILSYRPRRLVFVPTTFARFEAAEQINDLFDGSPLEDRLWQALKRRGIFAERQWKIIVEEHNYYLDFAIFCRDGKIAIETDGYTFHYDDRNPAEGRRGNQIDYDTFRRNEIELDGWRSLHFTTRHVKEQGHTYLAQIERAIQQLGGVQAPENYQRQTDEIRGRYITDGEEPL